MVSQTVLLVMNIENVSLIQSSIERLFNQSFPHWKLILLYTNELQIETIQTLYFY